LKKNNMGPFGNRGPATNRAYIRRINDDPYTGWTETGKGAWPSSDRAVVSFDLNGHPYLFGETKNRRAYIRRINDGGDGWTDVYEGQMEKHLLALSSFRLEGHSHILMLRADLVDLTRAPGGVIADWFIPGDQSKTPVNGEYLSLRINENPESGFVVWHRLEHAPDFEAFVPFELDGHPWLFSTNLMPDVCGPPTKASRFRK